MTLPRHRLANGAQALRCAKGVGLYDVEVVLLQRTGFLTSGQAATLMADAKTL